MKIKSNFKIKDNNNKIYILDSNYNVGYNIISFIVENGECKLEEIVDYLKKKYSHMDYTVLYNDTLEFVKELKNENIIEED